MSTFQLGNSLGNMNLIVHENGTDGFDPVKWDDPKEADDIPRLEINCTHYFNRKFRPSTSKRCEADSDCSTLESDISYPYVSFCESIFSST